MRGKVKDRVKVREVSSINIMEGGGGQISFTKKFKYQS